MEPKRNEITDLNDMLKLAGQHLDRVAFPLGGLGAGMICLEGTGALSHVSSRHKPDLHHEPQARPKLICLGGSGQGVCSYWNNQATGLVADVEFELILDPKNWGKIGFK